MNSVYGFNLLRSFTLVAVHARLRSTVGVYFTVNQSFEFLSTILYFKQLTLAKLKKKMKLGM